MKRYLTYLLPILLAAVSCKQEVPESESGLAQAAIQFSDEGVSTKGFLDSETFHRNGTKVRVQDWLTGFTGSVNGTPVSSEDCFNYVNDVVVYDGGEYWPYETTGKEYRWTKTGIHRFFGWLEFDRSYNVGAFDQGISTSNFFGSSPALDTDPTSGTFLTLTTPTYSWTPDSPQYDFLYSARAVTRDSQSPTYTNYSAIPLPMKHMFTAVGLCFKNSSTATNVDITGLGSMYDDQDLFLHKGYATVDYASSANPIQPVYHLEGDPDHPFFSGAAMLDKTIAPDEVWDIFTGTRLSTDSGETYTSNPQFYMTWPLTADQSWPQVTTGETDVYGNPIMDPKNNILALSYTAGGVDESTRIHFPHVAWEPGKKMLFIIDFTDKSIQIESQVLPWDLNVHDMSFDQDGVSSDGVSRLTIDGYDNLPDDATVHLTTENPELVCHVEIHSSVGSTLIISKVGPDPTYFEVEPAAITLTNRPIQFVVRASDLPTGGIERKMQLSMTVELPNGREIDVNTELLSGGNNYTFSRQ